MTERKDMPSSAEQGPVSQGRRAFVTKAYVAPTVVLLGQLGSIRNVSAQSGCCHAGDTQCQDQHPLWPICPP